jgi:hypothetical protein
MSTSFRGNDRLVSRDEAVDNALFLMFAGLETSVNMIAACGAALAAAPDRFAVLRGDPGLAASAVEEFLRYNAPTQITVTEPIDIADRPRLPRSRPHTMLGKAVFRRLAQAFVAFEPAGDVLRDTCTTPRIYLRVPLRVTT